MPIELVFRFSANKRERVFKRSPASRLTSSPPPYFDLPRMNLDSTTPAMMAPAITRIVVRSMFIDYPSSR
jgi:hypothetical protein